MAELKVYLPDDLDGRFRRIAMTVHGFGRGSLSKAAVEAIREWCLQKDPVQSQQPDHPTVSSNEAAIVADKRELPKASQDQTGPVSNPSTSGAG